MDIVDGTEYIAQVKELVVEYTTALGRDLHFQGIEEELSDPSQKYTSPFGRVLIAIENDAAWGMVAYHRHFDERCEMKRLYVKPAYRGRHPGEQLVERIIEEAKKAGYREMVLDTLRPMHVAISSSQQRILKHADIFTLGFWECGMKQAAAGMRFCLEIRKSTFIRKRASFSRRRRIRIMERRTSALFRREALRRSNRNSSERAFGSLKASFHATV